jgi:hypothetical protein
MNSDKFVVSSPTRGEFAAFTHPQGAYLLARYLNNQLWDEIVFNPFHAVDFKITSAQEREANYRYLNEEYKVTRVIEYVV